MLKKAEDPYNAIMDYRNTPLDIGLSPANMFLGRRLKTMLPTAASLLKPAFSKEVSEKLKIRQFRSKVNFDKHSRQDQLKELSTGDTVMMKNRDAWQHGTILSKHKTPRSYVIDSNGRNYRRNRRDIKSTSPKRENNENILDTQFTTNVYTETSNNKSSQIASKSSITNLSPTATESTKAELSPEVTHTRKPKLSPKATESSTATEILQSTTRQDTSCSIPSKVKTRSGRMINTPRRFQDFEQ